MRALQGVRVCMATSAHSADDDRIFFKQARSLANAGAEVTVLCNDRTQEPTQTFGVRFRKYVGGGTLGRRIISVHRLSQELENGRYDVIHCHEPDSLLAALAIKRRTFAKVVFDSHELWAGVAAGRFPRPFWSPIMAGFGLVERHAIAQCDAAIGATDAISEYLTKALGHERVRTILNVPVAEVFGEPQAPGPQDRRVFCHDGHLSFSRGLKTIAEAVRLASARHRLTFKIVGDVFGAERDWLDNYVSRHRLEDTIVRTGWLPYQEVGQMIGRCHVGLLAFERCPNHEAAAPNKVFNYLMYGLPIIGPKFVRFLGKLAQEDECCLLVNPGTPESYAHAIELLVMNQEQSMQMSDNARRASLEKYRWSHMEARLLDLYGSLLSGRLRERS